VCVCVSVTDDSPADTHHTFLVDLERVRVATGWVVADLALLLARVRAATGAASSAVRSMEMGAAGRGGLAVAGVGAATMGAWSPLTVMVARVGVVAVAGGWVLTAGLGLGAGVLLAALNWGG